MDWAPKPVEPKIYSDPVRRFMFQDGFWPGLPRMPYPDLVGRLLTPRSLPCPTWGPRFVAFSDGMARLWIWLLSG